MPSAKPKKRASTSDLTKKASASAPASKPASVGHKRKRAASESSDDGSYDSDEDYLPTLEDMKDQVKYRPYKLVQLAVPDQTKIRKGNDIFVLPGEVVIQGAPPTKKGKTNEKVKKAQDQEIWLAKVHDIRGESTSRVFLIIQWYYNESQLQEINYTHLKKLRLTGHGQEVVYTDHQEVIPIGACQDLARVYEFDESNVDQRSFEKDDYFFRHRVVSFAPVEQWKTEVKGQTKTTPPIVLPEPVPISPPSCSCGKPYRPLPLSSGSRMRLCPRPSCVTWHHARCLKTSSTPRSADHDLSFILGLPSEAAPKDDASATIDTEELQTRCTLEALESLPPSLVELAKQPIVRGTAADGVGIVGNAEAVFQAREIVREVLVLGLPLTEEWAHRCQITPVNEDGEGEKPEADGIVYAEGDKTDPVKSKGAASSKESSVVFKCPTCDDWM